MIHLPGYDLRAARREEVLPLFEEHHGYHSLGQQMTYCFAVYEGSRPVAAFAWQPPPAGAAKAVCPEAPGAVLSLSRMVAVPRRERSLNHISKPLRQQMRRLIDRGRWPALVTFSDEGQGHNGHVYKCSGWKAATRTEREVFETEDGRRASAYSNGMTGRRELVAAGSTWIQRWEHRVCAPGGAAQHLADHGWRRVAVPGKRWASGKQAYTYSRSGLEQIDLFEGVE